MSETNRSTRMHVMLEILAAGIAVVPIIGIANAVRRGASRRLVFALVAFVVLEARLLVMVAVHTFISIDHGTEDLLDFAGDLAVIVAFASAFLYGTRWLPERPALRPS